jgi:hypothetical protein
MAVQLAEAVKKGSGGEMILTVEESQGSVQNVKEAATRGGNYVFTTPPGLIKLAQGGKKMFEPKNAKFDEIRGLFPIPSLTMHFVVRKDSGVNSFADLEGKTFLIGKGSFGAREAPSISACSGSRARSILPKSSCLLRCRRSRTSRSTGLQRRFVSGARTCSRRPPRRT